MNAREVLSLPDLREAAEMVSTERFSRGTAQTFTQWHGRILAAEQLDRGEYAVLFPDELKRSQGKDGALQNVQNFAHDALRDHRRVVSEASPSVSAKARGNSDPARRESSVMVAIGTGYWTARDEMMIPELVMDIELAGAGFVLSYADAQQSETPQHMRLRPKGAYPTFFRQELFDMVYVERTSLRAIATKWPHLELRVDPKMNQMGEVVWYWTPTEYYQCCWAVDQAGARTGGAYALDYQSNPIDQVPIAWTANFDTDGNIEGWYDQAGPRQNAQNRITTLILDNADRQVYAQKKAKGWLNQDQATGPGFTYILDEQVQGADVDWLHPPDVSNQLFALNGALERSSRGTVSLPPSREGEVRQSIASAAFIEASMGAESSLVREDERHLAWLRTRQTNIDYALDKKVLDFEKPLIPSIGNKDTYKPSRDIDLRTRVEVIYPGFGAGKVNDTVLLVQMAGSGMISWETARIRSKDIPDYIDEERKIQLQEGRKLVFEKIQSRGGAYTSLKFVQLLGKGKSPEEVADELLSDPMVLQELGEQGAAGAQQGQAQPSAMETALALQKGGVPPQGAGAPPQSTFAPPPLPTVLAGGQTQNVVALRNASASAQTRIGDLFAKR